MHPSLMDCPDCGRPVSREAFACPGCGKPFRTDPRREGPYLRTMNVMTVAALWLIGIPIPIRGIMNEAFKRYRKSTMIEDRRVERDLTKPVSEMSTVPRRDPTTVSPEKMEVR